MAQEGDEAGFDKFNAMLYEAGENKQFTKANLQKEFDANLELIKSRQWLEEFPRGSKLLTYLYKILMCCESDLQAVKMLRRIFSRTFEPMLKMITDFIYTGEFDDPFDEFFIEKTRSGTLKITKRFEEKVPEFLGVQISKLIFKSGQNLNLLLNHDQE